MALTKEGFSFDPKNSTSLVYKAPIQSSFMLGRSYCIIILLFIFLLIITTYLKSSLDLINFLVLYFPFPKTCTYFHYVFLPLFSPLEWCVFLFLFIVGTPFYFPIIFFILSLSFLAVFRCSFFSSDYFVPVCFVL